MCLPLTEGHHDIGFHYASPGLRLGAAVTVCTAGIVIWMLVQDRKRKKGKNKWSLEMSRSSCRL